MKALHLLTLISAVALSSLQLASASPTLRFSIDNGASWVVVEDNGPLDGNPQAGVIQYNQTISGIALSFLSGQGNPFTGTPSVPNMDLSISVISSQPANLIVQFSDTNLTTFPTETYVDTVSLGTDGTVNQSSFRDSGNVLFGTTQTYAGGPAGTSPSPTALLLTSTGPVSSFNLFTSNAVVVNAVGNSPNSLTIESVISLPNGGSTSLDAHLFAQPQPQPPCNCTLTFNGSPTLAVCSGDSIPDVTATEDCGAGPVPVSVTVVGSSTTGTCPQTITRTNAATDDCGVVHTFVQTITVNCKPDCKITTVTSALAGATNLTASVADAGAGASYSWTISNGTITKGQGTRTITFTAGTTNNPTSIFVTVTNSSGCYSSCSASVVISPPPVCTIPGVLLSATSWNKFNIPTGTSPQVWVHMHIGGLKGIPTTGSNTIAFTGVTLTLNGTAYTLPDGIMVFDSSAPATPTTTFSGGKWITTFNPNNLSDEMFFDGAAIPVTASVAAGAKADLTYNTTASVQGISFNWQWSAAVYTFWPADWNQAGIQPYHGGSQGYHAGTPTNTTVQKSLIQGPRGGGGSNFTGSWSATGTAQCQ